MAFSFRICGTKKSPKPQTGGDWRTCIFWYDKSGEELTRAGVPVTVLANGFGRIRVTDAVPSGAASFAIQFGWDAPNVAEGRRYWIADVKLELLSDEATCGIEMPDVKAPLVFRQLAYHDECFSATNAACEIIVRGKRAPEWTLNRNQPGDIPFMPVAGDGEEVDLRFVPMACQRCHVTVFPQGTAAHR